MTAWRALLGAAMGCVVLWGCASAPTEQDEEKLQRAALYNVQLAMNYMQSNKLELADEKLKKAEEQAPNLPEVQNASAILAERLGEFDRAETHYRKAISIDPQDSNARTNYGAFLCKQGRFTQAQEQFDKALANPLFQHRETAMVTAGLCALQKPDVAQGEKYFRSALELNQNFLPALSEMAKLSFDKGNYLQTRAYIQRYDGALERAAEVNPAMPKGNPEMLWLCVRAELELGNRTGAQTCADKLKKLFPTSSETAQLLELERNVRNPR